MKKYIFCIVLILVPGSIFFLQEIHASTCRCNNKIVSLGESKIEVMKKCGEPTYTYARREEKIIKKYKKNTHNIEEDNHTDIDEKYLVEVHRIGIIIEEWTYNFGPTLFIRTFIFKNNRLVAIKTGGYGVEKKKPLTSGWGKYKIKIGALTAEVLMKYGEPTHKNKRYEERVTIQYLDEKHLQLEEHRIVIDIEEWTYNFGPNLFTRTLLFKNNRLVSIHRGGYGYE